MAGVYRARHPERTILYRVLFHYFDRFLAEYENQFEKEYGFFRPIVKEVVDRDVPHRQVVFTIPKMLRIFFKHNRRLLGSLYRSALRSLTCYFETVAQSELMPAVIAAIQTSGDGSDQARVQRPGL
jgi:hypothetical protein